MKDAAAAAVVVIVGLTWTRTGRNPLRLAIAGLLHLRAAGWCARMMAAAAWEVARRRYRECYQRAWRELME